jgi:glucose-1-phosphate adenylyltransferase
MNYDALIAFHMDHSADMTMATIRVPMEEAPRFGIVDVDNNFRVQSFVEKPSQPPSNLVNMGVYLFNLDVLNQALWDDHQRGDSSHDFGKDILPRMISTGARVIAYPYSGYWVDVGTVGSYWKAHMDLLAEPTPIDLNDRSWIIHTRTEERPPMRIQKGASVVDSMISDGCVISEGAQIERSILSPGVQVGKGAIVRASVVLTDTIIEANAAIENAIIDKRVRVGEEARIGSASEEEEPLITMVGKNCNLPRAIIIEPGAILGTDVIESDLASLIVRRQDIIETKRQPYEV